LDARGGHLYLRHYAAYVARSGSVHAARCELRNARPTGVLLCDRTYGDLLAWTDRYTANHSLREHDHRDAGAHAPGISIPQMEALSDGRGNKRAPNTSPEKNSTGSNRFQRSRANRSRLISRRDGELDRL